MERTPGYIRLRQRIERMEAERSPSSFVALEDGYVYYWVGGEHRGAVSAPELRVIADILDDRNRAWDEQINQASP